MKINIRLCFFVMATFLASSVYALSYEDGQAAFDTKDYKKAVEIWESLAGQGDVSSQLKMAELHDTRGLIVKGVEIVKWDPSESFKFYNLAAEQGSLEAQVQLGLFYMSGKGGITRDPEKGREHFLEAANQGYAKAQYHYGVTYFRGGEGILTDYVQAYAWIHVASIRGYEPAKAYSEYIVEVLSKEQLEEAKNISDQLLAEIK